MPVIATHDGWELWTTRSTKYTFIDHIVCPSEAGIGLVNRGEQKCAQCGNEAPDEMTGMMNLLEWEK